MNLGDNMEKSKVVEILDKYLGKGFVGDVYNTNQGKALS